MKTCFWRKFEDKLAGVYIQQKVRGFLHLYNGQEAVLAGSLHAMEIGKDRMITAYRNHVQPIGMGVDPKRVMAELYGKATERHRVLVDLCTFFQKNTSSMVDTELLEVKSLWEQGWPSEINISIG